MGFRAFIGRQMANWVTRRQQKWINRPVQAQKHVFENLVANAEKTVFGKDHNFKEIKSYDDYKLHVPIRDYEGLKPYIQKIIEGQKDVLWKGVPSYFSKTSGTTSGAKYIPITKASIPNHILSARNALFAYISETGNSKFLDGKLIFLSGSPVLGEKTGIPTGRLSGIVNHHVPHFFRTNKMPSYETNCIDDWELKVDKIVEETMSENMTLISGIPPWVQMYFEKINERTGKKIKDVFPNFSLFIYGGVNFEPYKKKLYEIVGKEVDSIETYPASEGFIAYQDSQKDPGLLLLLNSGIFFEFIPSDEVLSEHPPRLTIGEVELGVNYAIIINSNAGLWGYSLGDTVKFVSKKPYRLIVTGRIKHFISAFGEHVIGEEVERAMNETMKKYQDADLTEFTVAPQVNPEEGLPLHEWYVEFTNLPEDLSAFEKDLNLRLQKINAYYDDLIFGKVLRNLKVIPLQRDAFRKYMKSLGKLGGQNKVPRLSNDRSIANEISKYKLGQ